VQVPYDKNKATQIIQLHGAERIDWPVRWEDVPADKALVVVVDNGPFEAAGFAYDEREFRDFTDPTDRRRHEYLLLPWETACDLTDAPPWVRERTRET
jgi:hypothetical protein